MWRDFAGMMTAGRTFRAPLVVGCTLLVLAAVHGLAWMALRDVDLTGRSVPPACSSSPARWP